MMRVVILSALFVVALPWAAFAVEDSYDCVHTGHTNIGWSGSRETYTAEAVSKVTKPSTVKLSAMNTDQPSLTGQDVARLRRLSGDDTREPSPSSG